MHLFVQTRIKWKRLLKRSRAMFSCAIYSKRYPAKTQFLQQRRTQNCHVTRKISIWSSLELYVCFPKLKYKNLQTWKYNNYVMREKWVYCIQDLQTFLSSKPFSFCIAFWGLPLVENTANWLKTLCSIIKVWEVQEVLLVLPKKKVIEPQCIELAWQVILYGIELTA